MGPESIGSSPVFPITNNMESGVGVHLLSQLKINTAKRNFFFKISLGFKDLEMLRLLISKGVIRRFYKIHQTVQGRNLYMVHPNYTQLGNSNLRLVLFTRNADHITVTLRALHLLNKATGSSSFIIKTDRGILTHQEALRLRVGGVLLCFVYN